MKSRKIVLCSLLACCLVFAGVLYFHPAKVKASNPLTLNPTVYDCIKDNGVVSQTISYDPTGRGCDMVVQEAPTVTVAWPQLVKTSPAFSGSVLNYSFDFSTPTANGSLCVDGFTSGGENTGYLCAVTPSGIGQTIDVYDKNWGLCSPPDAKTQCQWTGTTGWAFTKLSVNVTPPLSPGDVLAVELKDTMGALDAVCEINGALQSGQTSGSSGGCMAQASNVWLPASDGFAVQFHVSAHLSSAISWTSLTWTVQ